MLVVKSSKKPDNFVGKSFYFLFRLQHRRLLLHLVSDIKCIETIVSVVLI
jgi:hypothetical protein